MQWCPHLLENKCPYKVLIREVSLLENKCPYKVLIREVSLLENKCPCQWRCEVSSLERCQGVLIKS